MSNGISLLILKTKQFLNFYIHQRVIQNKYPNATYHYLLQRSDYSNTIVLTYLGKMKRSWLGIQFYHTHLAVGQSRKMYRVDSSGALHISYFGSSVSQCLKRLSFPRILSWQASQRKAQIRCWTGALQIKSQIASSSLLFSFLIDVSILCRILPPSLMNIWC